MTVYFITLHKIAQAGRESGRQSNECFKTKIPLHVCCNNRAPFCKAQTEGMGWIMFEMANEVVMCAVRIVKHGASEF